MKAAEVVEKTTDVNKKTLAAAKSRLGGFLKFDVDDQLLGQMSSWLTNGCACRLLGTNDCSP